MKKSILIAIVSIFSLTISAQTINTVGGVPDWNMLNKSGFYKTSVANSLNGPVVNHHMLWGLNIAYETERYNGQMVFEIMPHNRPTNPPNVWVRSTTHLGEGVWAKLIHDKGSQVMEGDLTVKFLTSEGNIHIGKNITGRMTEGPRLYFQGVDSNTDNMFISKYNRSSDKTDLRVSIGDDNAGDDRFIVGNTIAGNWKSWLSVANNGRVGIGVEDPRYELDVNGDASFKNLIVGSSEDNSLSELKILGPNSPTNENSKRDIVFDFKDAGKSMIRSYRGGAWDTHLEFYTTGAESSSPQKRMSLSYQDIRLLGETSIGESRSGEFIRGEEGYRLYLRGTHWNNDDIYLSRYNRAEHYTDLRANVGFSSEDRLVVGYTQWVGSNSVWMPAFTVQGDGKVGIGVENPTEALEVKGTICAKKVRIEVKDWADFVFSKDYELPTLESVEQHIGEHKHLPGIPSEKEVTENGIDMADMQAKLLQKVEELTLYVIEQDKKIKDLQSQLNRK